MFGYVCYLCCPHWSLSPGKDVDPEVSGLISLQSALTLQTPAASRSGQMSIVIVKLGNESARAAALYPLQSTCVTP